MESTAFKLTKKYVNKNCALDTLLKEIKSLSIFSYKNVYPDFFTKCYVMSDHSEIAVDHNKKIWGIYKDDGMVEYTQDVSWNWSYLST